MSKKNQTNFIEDFINATPFGDRIESSIDEALSSKERLAALEQAKQLDYFINGLKRETEFARQAAIDRWKQPEISPIGPEVINDMLNLKKEGVTDENIEAMILGKHHLVNPADVDLDSALSEQSTIDISTMSAEATQKLDLAIADGNPVAAKLREFIIPIATVISIVLGGIISADVIYEVIKYLLAHPGVAMLLCQVLKVFGRYAFSLMKWILLQIPFTKRYIKGSDKPKTQTSKATVPRTNIEMGGKPQRKIKEKAIHTIEASRLYPQLSSRGQAKYKNFERRRLLLNDRNENELSANEKRQRDTLNHYYRIFEHQGDKVLFPYDATKFEDDYDDLVNTGITGLGSMNRRRNNKSLMKARMAYVRSFKKR